MVLETTKFKNLTGLNRDLRLVCMPATIARGKEHTKVGKCSNRT